MQDSRVTIELYERFCTKSLTIICWPMLRLSRLWNLLKSRNFTSTPNTLMWNAFIKEPRKRMSCKLVTLLSSVFVLPWWLRQSSGSLWEHATHSIILPLGWDRPAFCSVPREDWVKDGAQGNCLQGHMKFLIVLLRSLICNLKFCRPVWIFYGFWTVTSIPRATAVKNANVYDQTANILICWVVECSGFFHSSASSLNIHVRFTQILLLTHLKLSNKDPNHPFLHWAINPLWLPSNLPTPLPFSRHCCQRSYAWSSQLRLHSMSREQYMASCLHLAL